MLPKHFGWHDASHQDEATHDPGFDAPCPHCGTRVGRHHERPIKTISVMGLGATRSYFYRVHKDCHEAAAPDAITDIESVVIDGVH